MNPTNGDSQLSDSEIVRRLRSQAPGECKGALGALFPDASEVVLIYSVKGSASLAHSESTRLSALLGLLMWGMAKVAELSKLAILVGSMEDPRKQDGLVVPKGPRFKL